jgi:hypothetical protein
MGSMANAPFRHETWAGRLLSNGWPPAFTHREETYIMKVDAERMLTSAGPTVLAVLRLTSFRISEHSSAGSATATA